MTLDKTLRQAAKRLIGDYGKSATLRRETQGTFEPADSSYSGGSSTDYSITVSPPQEFDQQFIDGDLIRQDDFMVSVAAKGLSVTPNSGDESTNDKLVLDSVVYEIVRAKPVYSGAQVALYKLHCRK